MACLELGPILYLQKIDEGAVHIVFSKSLENYIKWCNYLPLRPVWTKYGFLFLYNFSDSYVAAHANFFICLLVLILSIVSLYYFLMSIICSLESAGKEKKLMFVCLYYLIWGEASNVRFLPECLCYIFHHVSSVQI